MLPMEVQRELVFTFKTRTLGIIPQMEEAEQRVKQDIVCHLRSGGKLCHWARASLYVVALQKRFYDSLLAFDVNAAEKAFEDYKSVTQSHLDSLLFDEETFKSVTVLSATATTKHTKDDAMAVAYGNSIRNTAKVMQSGLVSLKKLRRTCAMAI
jgi:hypothetical protein